MAGRRFWREAGLIAALLAGAVAGSGAAAAPDPVPPELLRFAEQPANRQAVLAMVQDEATRLPGECRTLSFTSSRISVSVSPHFDAGGRPLHGQWKKSWTATGCGRSKIFNVEIFARDNGALSRLLLMPGTTLAPPGLQSDAMLHATTAATSGGCQDRTVVDTAYLGLDPAPAQGKAAGHEVRPWWEDWTVNSCGSVAVVTLHFMPDASIGGIRITASAKAK